MNLDPEETALLVVDIQNDFCHPDGALYSEASEAVIEPINELIEQARAGNAEVIFTRDAHSDEQFEDAHYYDEYDQWGKHCEPGSWGWELHDDLSAVVGDLAIDKPSYDAFYETRLDEYLSEMGVKNLVIVGTLANVCVLHTAARAGLRDYKPVLVEDCVGYIAEDHKEYALDHADFLFGEVADSNSLSFEGDE